MENEVQVETGSGTKERVAYDLMMRILYAEKGNTKENARERVLTLYSQCLKVVNGGRADLALANQEK
jgi:hypothetical protein